MIQANVQDFGAAGNGVAKDTAAIQQAISQTARQGGGTVFFPPGCYLAGTLYLEDNIHLKLSPGAVLLGSPDRADYNADDFCPQNRVFTKEKVSGAHLLVALHKKNITLSGGAVNGNRQVWLNEVDPERPAKFLHSEWRPGQMIFFCECENIRIRDTELLNPPYWTCFLHGCDHVFIRGVKVKNDFRTPNGDGFDIDCCRNVCISDCQIESGDDCFAIRGNTAPLSDSGRPCEWITITNCTLSTPCNAFRIGVGDGVIRNINVSNCIIHNTRTGICIINRYGQNAPGVAIENISFDNIRMDTVRPLMIAADVRGPDDRPSKFLRNISFSHIRGRGCRSNFIEGNSDCNLSGITLDDVIFEYYGGDEIEACMKRHGSFGEFGISTADAAFYLRNASDIEFNRVRVKWGKLTGSWKSALNAENVADLSIRDCSLLPPEP